MRWEMTELVSAGATRGLNFTVEIDATSDLAVDASRVEALVTVKAHSAAAAVAAPAAPIAEVLIMDRSKSMIEQNKIHEARRAACAAIDAMPDGALLGIVAGNHEAQILFPPTGGLATVDARTKAAAKHRVMGLWPEHGTRISRWLRAADDLFAAAQDAGAGAGAIRHAVLYTDGKNEHETPAELDAALSACADRFVCDVRGLGDDWHYEELRRIADALDGDATAVLRIADLTDDFTRLIHRARRLVVPRVYLRLRPNSRFRIGSIAQTHPVRVDLADRQRQVDGGAVDVPLGSWEPGTRRYQLSLHFDPGSLPAEEELRAARIEVLAQTDDGMPEQCADAALIVRRHATPGFETRKPESLTLVEKERELALAMQACADAWLHKQTGEADDELERAISLAHAVGDPVRLRLLFGVATTGTDGRTRLRRDVTRGEMQRIGLDSTKTSVPMTDAGPQDEADRQQVEARICPVCHEVTYAPNPKRCEACGAPFDDRVAP
jgi:Mg-chelatase subunit ChlD